MLPPTPNRRLTISGPEMGEPVVLPISATGTAVIGRQEGSDLQVEHPLVSRRHARLEGTPEACRLIDLGSTYGTLVNGQRLVAEKAHILKNGDVIEIGPYRILYEETIAAEPFTAVRPGGAGQSLPPQPPPRPSSSATTGVARTPYSNGFQPTIPEPITAPDLPPGLYEDFSRYLQYLPEIYHPSRGEDDFLVRFLAMFESIWAPIEWNVDNFDLYLDPETAPYDFMPWLAGWYNILFDDSWDEKKRRALLREAPQIYARRGTRWAVARILEIYTGVEPDIDDTSETLNPFTFTVTINHGGQSLNRRLIEQLIDVNKPAHTSYKLVLRN